LNVVLIFQESTYNQHLSLFGGTNDTQPLLSHYKDRMELFPNFFSNFAGSIYARFATFSGLYPVQDFKVFTKDPVPVKTLFDVLADHGYDCSVFYSSFADYTNFRDLLRAHGVKRLFDADSMPGTRSSEPVAWGLKEEETLGAIEQQINDYATNGKRFFLTYVPAAPHNPFDGTPERFRRFKDENIGDFTPRYLNELLYMDWVISGILDRLKETGLLDRTLVVITADHGEMLGGQGKPIGHGWAITPQLANVPLIIMDPSKRFYRVNDAIGSQVDVLPTVLDILGVPLPADEIYQGTSLLHTNLDTNRIIYLNSFRQFATIRQNTFSCGDRELGSGAQGESYQITNELTHTSFVRRGAAVPSANIDEFDHFQENFLEHYRDYVRLIQDRRRTK
jgi:arylsulfatase A-like enzyme